MQFRISGIMVSSCVGVALIGIHLTGRLWPILPGTIAIGAVVLIFASHRFGPSIAWLLGACGLLFAHTAIALLYPETLSGIDPDSYAMWVSQVVNSGSVSQAETSTYSTLPVFLLLISTISEITNLFPRSAFVTIPILVSVLIPFITAWFTTILTGCSYQEWPAVPAALLSSILTMTVVSGYLPIAMTVGYLLMFLAFVVSIRYFLQGNKSNIIAFLILGVGVTFSHRFIILILALGVIVQGVVLAALKDPYRNQSSLIVLPTIGILLLFIQWLHLTTSAAVTVYQLMFIFTEPAAQRGVDVAAIQTSVSTPVIESRTFGIISRRAHGIVLIPIAGIAWLYFASIELTQLRDRVLLYLSTTAVVGAFLPLSILFSNQLNYTRSISVAEPVLISLAIGFGWVLWRRLNTRSKFMMQSGRGVLIFFGVVLIASQVGSAPISADHPTSSRDYLESDEVSAKMWGYQYAGTNISADPFFAQERPLPEAHVDSDGRIKEDYRHRYREMLEPYTDRSIVETCPEAVMYREINVYRSPRAQVLQWDPEPTLDKEYTRQYDGGKVQHYTNPRCR